VQLAKAYIGSRPSKVSPSMLSMQSPTGEDSTLLKGHHFAQKSPIMSVVPRAINHTRVYENGFLTPRSRGRSVIYNMARTPYPRVYPDSTTKVCHLLKVYWIAMFLTSKLISCFSNFTGYWGWC